MSAADGSIASRPRSPRRRVSLVSAISTTLAIVCPVRRLTSLSVTFGSLTGKESEHSRDDVPGYALAICLVQEILGQHALFVQRPNHERHVGHDHEGDVPSG